jgi:hypothetical protein
MRKTQARPLFDLRIVRVAASRPSASSTRGE